MSDLYAHIGETIRNLRSNRVGGVLSQEGLAKEIGVAANTVSRWETGTYKPTPEDLDAVARFFKVPITVFFPDSSAEDTKLSALTSALGDLDPNDIAEALKYAEFRKMRRLMKTSKKPSRARKG